MNRPSFSAGVLMLVVSFSVASYLGHVYGACSQDCEDIECRSVLNPADPDFPCAAYAPTSCNPTLAFWNRDAPGGDCVAMIGEPNLVYKCPDCNPECINDPSEATGCVFPTPGGADTCVFLGSEQRFACQAGT